MARWTHSEIEIRAVSSIQIIHWILINNLYANMDTQRIQCVEITRGRKYRLCLSVNLIRVQTLYNGYLHNKHLYNESLHTVFTIL